MQWQNDWLTCPHISWYRRAWRNHPTHYTHLASAASRRDGSWAQGGPNHRGGPDSGRRTPQTQAQGPFPIFNPPSIPTGTRCGRCTAGSDPNALSTAITHHPAQVLTRCGGGGRCTSSTRFCVPKTARSPRARRRHVKLWLGVDGYEPGHDYGWVCTRVWARGPGIAGAPLGVSVPLSQRASSSLPHGRTSSTRPHKRLVPIAAAGTRRAELGPLQVGEGGRGGLKLSP
jgi:hypothetical protein